MSNQQAGRVFYQSIERGLSNPDGAKAVNYVGKVFRIPRSEHGTIRQLEWEPNPRDLIEGDHSDANGQPTERVSDGIVERFEVIDQETGDVLVMYRVPHEEKC